MGGCRGIRLYTLGWGICSVGGLWGAAGACAHIYTGDGYLQCRGGGAAGKDTLTLHTGDPIMHRGGEETWSQTTINGDTGVRNRGEGS